MFEAILAAAVLHAPSPEPFNPAKPTAGVHAPAIAGSARIPKRIHTFASCVSERESHGNYRARSRTSSSQGRWQLLDNAWRKNGGIEYVVTRRLAKFGVPAHIRSIVRDYLDRTEIARWPGPYQDIAFVQIVAEGGAHHWHKAGSRCNTWMPR